MARFGQGLIQGLINPGYELNTTGMMAGGLAGRIAERKKEELQRQQQQAALMSAYKMGQSPGGSDPASAMAALTQAVPGVQAKDLVAMQQAGLQTAALRKEEQAKRDAAVLAASRAKNVGVPQEAIDALSLDPETLNAYSKELEDQKRAATIDSQNRNRQIAIQLGVARNNNAPPEVISDIQSGVYVENNSEFLDLMQGKGTNIEEYQNQTTGVVNSYPEKDGRLYVNNKWVLPTEAGLVKAPSRTAEDSSAKFTPTKSTSAQIAMMGAASGTLLGVIDELETVKDARGAITLSAISPFALDETSTLKASQNLVPEALGRALSGAAIKDDEMPRFEEMFSIRLMDFTSPVTIATKLVRTAALTSATSKLAAGEISPQEARALMVEAGSLTLTKEDKQKLQQGKLKEVVRPYVTKFTGEQSKKENTAESIFDTYGV